MSDISDGNGVRYGALPIEQQDEVVLQQARALALNQDIINATNPWIGQTNPEAVFQLASSGMAPDDLALRSSELYAMQNLERFSDSLIKLNPAAQRSIYTKLSIDQQRALLLMGYELPSDDVDGSWTDGLGVAGDVIAAAWSPIRTVGGPIVGPAWDFLLWSTDQPARLYRTIRSQDGVTQIAAAAGAAAALYATRGRLGPALQSVGAGSITTSGAFGLTALAGASTGAFIVSPGEFLSTLETAKNGERLFSEASQRRAQEILEAEPYLNLAKEIAIDLEPFEIAAEMAGTRDALSWNAQTESINRIAATMADPGTTEYRRIVGALTQLVQEAPFQAAIKELQNGKISFGRDIANLAGLDPGTGLYNVVSGAADAAWLWGLDPLVGAGLVKRANRIRRYGMPTSLDAAQQADWFRAMSNNNSKIRRKHEDFVDAINTGQLQNVPFDLRKTVFPFMEYLRQAGKFDPVTGQISNATRKDFVEWITDGINFTHILRGQGTLRGVERTILTTRTTSAGWGKFVKEMRAFSDSLDSAGLAVKAEKIAKQFGVTRDLDAVAPSRMLERLLDEGGLVELSASSIADNAAGGIGARLGTALAKVPGTKTVGQFLGSTSTMALDGKAIALVGDEAFKDIDRLVNHYGRLFGLSRTMRDQWVNAALLQSNSNQRSLVMQSFLDSLLTGSGLRTTAEGERLANQFLYLHKHTYSLGGADELIVDGRRLVRGWLPGNHSATHFLVPDVKTLLEVVQRDTMLRTIFGIVDHNLVESAMTKIWKPAVILRLGFIPRAAGEEALAWFNRAMVGGVMQEAIGRSVAKRDAYHAARRAIDNGRPSNLDKQIALEWDLPAFYKPLYWMAARVGWKPQVELVLENWLRNFDQFTKDGFNIQSLQNLTGATDTFLLGRPNSLRRFFVNGLDAGIQASARSWTLRHADALMAGTSAMTHNVFVPEIGNINNATRLLDNPNSPGSLRSEDILTLRNQTERIYMQDPAFDTALHWRVNEPFYDPVVGPAALNAYLKFEPKYFNFQNISNKDLYELYRDLYQINKHDSVHLVSAYLSQTKGYARTDFMEGVANSLDDYLPEVSEVLRNVIQNAQPEGILFDDMLGKLNALHLKTRSIHKNNLGTAEEILRASFLEKILNRILSDLSSARPVIKKLSALDDAAEAGYLIAHASRALFTSDIKSSDVSRMADWANNRIVYDPNAPTNIPFLNQAENLDDVIKYEIQAALMRPENAGWVKQSQAVNTFEGQPIIDEIPDGLVNIYTPILTDGGSALDDIINNLTLGPNSMRQLIIKTTTGNRVDETVVDDIVEILFNSPTTWRTHNDFVSKLSETNQRMLLKQAVNRYIRQRQEIGGGLNALGVGYDDPRIAQWVGNALTGNGTIEQLNVTEFANNLGYLQIPRGLNTDRGGANILSDITAIGKQYDLSEIATQNVNFVDFAGGETWLGRAPNVVLSGPTYANAMESSAERIQKILKQIHYSGGNEIYKLKNGAPPLYKVSGDLTSEVPAGSSFVGKTSLFDDAGNPVRFGDRTYFEATLVKENDEELLWELIGPMIADHYAERNGYLNRSVAPGGKKDQLRTSAAFEYDVNAVETGFVDYTHSRVDDVKTIKKEKLPNATYGEIPRNPASEPGLWEKIVLFGFNKIVGPSLNSLVRRPMTFHYYHAARNENIKFLNWMVNPELKSNLMKDAPDFVDEIIKANNLTSQTLDQPAFVAEAYYQIPDEIWEKGRRAVNQVLNKNNLEINNYKLKYLTEENFDVVSRLVKNYSHVYKTVEDTAVVRALENVIPFIDDARIKTQFSYMARNFLPFWYAEEQFLRRWAKSLSIAPESLVRGQLLYMGMRSAGIVQTDVNGQDWVVYPGSGLLNEAMAKIPFMPDSLDVTTVFRASTDSLLPGLNAQLGTPQLSPLAALPVATITNFFPELQSAKRAMLGEVGAQQSLGSNPLEAMLSQAVPVSLRRLWRAIADDENNSVAFANSMSYAMANMLAENPDLLNQATPEELQEFLDKARAHARIILFAQTITGFVVPGAPSAMRTSETLSLGQQLSGFGIENPDTLISDQYRDYVRNMGIDEGTRAFLRDFPFADLQDVTAEGAMFYTTATSQSLSGSPLPATRIGMAWYEQNQDWVDQNTYAAPWLIPQDTSEAVIDQYAYNQQLTYELRKRLTPAEVLNSFLYRTAAGDYFDSQRAYEEAKAQIPSENRDAHKLLDTDWELWKDNYLVSHPVFAEELTNGNARVRRQNTIEQMRYVVNDPAAPDSPYIQPIRELSEAYDAFVVVRKQLSQSNSRQNLQAKVYLKEDFENWVANWILQNPELERLWNSVYKPEANL